MRLLLDTCSLIWALQSPDKFGVEARQALESVENSIHVSPVSFWEISLKFALGKLRIEGSTPEEIPVFVGQAGWHVIELDVATVSYFHRLPTISGHKDPFDLLLIWTAIREKFLFVSKDRVLPEYERMGLITCK